MKRIAYLTLAIVAGFGCSDDGDSGSTESAADAITVRYDDSTSRLMVSLASELKAGETLHARLRRGGPGELDCARDAAAIDRIDGTPAPGGLPTFAGPAVSDAQIQGSYSTEWLERAEPTAEMLAAIADGEYFVDVCRMKAGAPVAKVELELRRALDRVGADGKFDGEGARVSSPVAYAELCVAEMGEIPFFPKLADGDYATYNCLDSTPIPTTVTDAEGNVTYPDKEVAKCDHPQYIYSLCEPNAVNGQTNGPRVASRANEQGTHWVLLCRKSRQEEGSYNDIAMIGHNPFTGKTCYFQNALYSKTDGLHIPHPGDKTESEGSPQLSSNLWNGMHGGLGSGIQCAECHDADPFIHTPWIDGAKDEKGDPVIPKMGVHEDFALGFNEAPYSIVNLEAQGWTMPKSLVSPEAAACTRCHRMGDGRWTKNWIDRMDGSNTAWANKTTESHLNFDDIFWMPPELDGVDEESWPESEIGKAFNFVKKCGDNPSECEWAELPTEQITEEGELPEVELEGEALAKAGLIVLGADIEDPSCPDGKCETRRCAECHSTSRNGLRRWLDATQDAWEMCGLAKDPAEMTPEEAQSAVDCLRNDPSDPDSVFAAEKLGVLSTGVQYGRFRELFRAAYGLDGWLIPYNRFKARVGMPKGNHAKLSQREFAILVKWFESDLSQLDTALPEAPPPESCEPFYDAEAIAAHVEEMQFDGWGALNAEAGIRMFGCSGDDPLACFADAEKFADRTTLWGGEDSPGTLRVMTELSFKTSFWTRSSADGRFVGNGGGPEGSTITDLLNGRDIGVDASYDPGFFPDNSGFIFQGATGGAGLCAQSILETDDVVDFTEPECITARGINLYQHVARGVGGGDYFVINSQFTSDSGSSSRDPSASFGGNATMKFTPMVFDGTTYDPQREVIVDSPYEGDSVLSPSSKLVISRLAGPESRGLGYVVRGVNYQRSSNGYIISVEKHLATVCAPGAKANLDFNERFFVTHHYEEDGTANIYLHDLVGQTQHAVTKVPEGTKALFPHFRSDGWFYFLVRTGEAEFVVASDAALRLATGGR